MSRKITAVAHRNVVNLQVPDDLSNLTSEEISASIFELQRAQAQIEVYAFNQRVEAARETGASETEAVVMVMTGFPRERLSELGGLSEEA